ncbi:Dyp-type peroxidase [Yinghuangia soli]|uniref:Dyp-type peroxidase n=1 Tax=Yinghuangia soli TaxID=2908204 RepID=A0AA41PYY0_9ACTN|nr:Dyp-type peroxidase [Yinghuangia soli]MCF2527915.1 Dyp-type peroxidase [Yinghuangia soli]
MTSAPSAEPQPVLQAVLAPLTKAAVFLVVTVDPGGEEQVRDLVPDISGLVRSVGFRAPEDGLTCITGIGSDAWDRLFGGPRPAELHPLAERTGAAHRAPSTPGDLLFHIRAQRMDLCFELATHLMARLKGAVTVRDEVHGFKYFDDRDLLGFVDGTENPVGSPAHRAAFTTAQADPDFAGGSYVIVQKYLHDMEAWNALPVEAQERAVGRTKLSDIEMSDEEKPPNSHVALTTVEDADGVQQQIVRLNMPFGTLGRGEFGTYFIGYCATPSVTEEMLDNMFLGSPPGVHDRLLDFSTAVTGSLYFVPSQDFLDDPPGPPGETAAAETAGEAEADGEADDPDSVTDPFDGSLRIGSLKRSNAR